MRKQIHLPFPKRRNYGSIAEEFARADIIDEIFRAADDGRDFDIETDPDTAQYINDFFGCEIAHAKGGVVNERR